MRAFADSAQFALMLMGYFGFVLSVGYFVWQLWDALTTSVMTALLGFTMIGFCCMVLWLILITPMYWMLKQLR